MTRRRILSLASASVFALLSAAAAGAQEITRGDMVVLGQGWDVDARRLFYNEAQGSPIIPLAWFLALEQPGETQALFQENTYLAGFGLIPEAPHERNPHGLPIGLTEDRGLIGPERMLGMNCAACHVGVLEANGTAFLVDGAPANFDFMAFMDALDLAMVETLSDEATLERFAARLSRPVDAVRRRLAFTVRERDNWRQRNVPELPPGPGRVDALGVILNQVTAYYTRRPDNARTPDAPVSYPFLWGAPYLTHVQYNGVAPNEGAGALARNVGQVLGVFGEVSLVSASLPPGYASSVSLGPLGDLEGTLETLTPPTWEGMAARGALPAIDEAAAARGERVYAQTCLACHALMDGEDPGPLAETPISMEDVGVLGTDPTAAWNFTRRLAYAGPLAGKPTLYAAGEPLCEEAFASDLLVHVTLGVLANEAASHARQVGGSVIRGIGRNVSRWLGIGGEAEDLSAEAADIDAIEAMGDFTRSEDAGYGESKEILESITAGQPAPRHVSDGCGHVERPAQYRGRPLNAVWATGPFLHNGSVPTLAALLMDPADRPDRFYVGARRFDPVALGFESGPGDGRVLYDTSFPGNSNAGHAYGVELTDAQKRDLLEYMKTL